MEVVDRVSSPWEHDFPADLWLSEVLGRLYPIDVLSLSQTCSSLRTLLSCRSVWLDILGTVIREHGLFPPSFPLDAMEMSELQRASLAPYLWKSLVERNAVPVEKFDDAPYLRAQDEEAAQWRRCYRAFLVPGGRFLVYLCERSTRVTLDVWDLGIPVPKTARRATPTLIARKDILPVPPAVYWRSLWEISVRPKGDDTLRIAVTYFNDSARIWVYSIEPAGKNLAVTTALQELATGTIEQTGQQRVYLQGDRILLQEGGGSFVLWNYVARRVTKWSYFEGPVWADELALTDSHVLLFSKTELWIWSIAGLGSRAQSSAELGTDSAPHDRPPDLRLPFQFPSPLPAHCDTFILPVHSAFWGEFSLVFDIFDGRFQHTIDRPVLFHRFRLSQDRTSGFEFKHLGTGDLPNYIIHHAMASQGRRRGADIDNPCITASNMFKEDVHRSSARRKTFIYQPPKASTSTEDYVNGDVRGCRATPLTEHGYLSLISSCSSSGRCIYDRWESVDDEVTATLVIYL